MDDQDKIKNFMMKYFSRSGFRYEVVRTGEYYFYYPDGSLVSCKNDEELEQFYKEIPKSLRFIIEED